MSHDIYVGLSGASAAWSNLDVIANNLANASTNGYKADRVAFELTGPNDSPVAQAYASINNTEKDMSGGMIRQTGNPLDVALLGEGFFSVQSTDGETLLTRNGQFSINLNNQLTTLRGELVLSDGGPLDVPPGETLSIQQDGRIFGSLSGELGRLQILKAEDVSPIGNTLFRANGATQVLETPSVNQGALEGSNVDAMSMMVELLESSHFFEANEKILQTSDQMDTRLFSRRG